MAEPVKTFTWRPPPVTEDLPRRSDFVQGATAGGLLRGLAVAAILSRVAQGRGGAPRRQR